MRRREAYERIDEIRNEYEAARFAIRLAISVHRDGPETLLPVEGQGKITISQFEMCARNLEITYTIRLFAGFEGILRDYWLKGRGRTSQPMMEQLLVSIATYRTMKEDDLFHAHEVRTYRNELIHENVRDPRFNFSSCCSHLARYLSWLPLNW